MLLASAVSGTGLMGRTWPGHTAPATNSIATLTWLEINGWLLSSAGVTVLLDPLLEGALDFGIPDIYSARRRVLPDGLTAMLPALDGLLITQGLDDHAHTRTLSKLAKLDPNLPVVAPPSARPVLERCFRNVRYIASKSRRVELPYLGLDGLPTIRLPDGTNADEATIMPRVGGVGGGLRVLATSGALVGPPWQRRENGYVVRPLEPGGRPVIYVEPHVEFDAAELARLAPVDAVVTPVSGQGLPGFELVHGPSASVSLIKALRPRWVLPMRNGNVDATGLSSAFVNEFGADGEFERQLQEAGVRTEVRTVEAGVPVTLGCDDVRVSDPTTESEN